MNIKNLYSFSGAAAVLCIAARYLQLEFGTDSRGLAIHGSVFSWLLIPLLILALAVIFVMSCNCYGVTKITEIEVPTALCPASVLLGGATVAVAIITFFGNAENRLPLDIADLVLSILSGIGFIILGIAVIRDIDKRFLYAMFFPVLLFSVKLVNMFLSNIAIISDRSLSLQLIKTVFMLLFLLYMPIYFFNPQFDKKTPTVLFYGFSSSVIVLTDIVPMIISGTFKVAFISDFLYVIYVLVFVDGLIKTIIKKSNSLKQKIIEEQ